MYHLCNNIFTEELFDASAEVTSDVNRYENAYALFGDGVPKPVWVAVPPTRADVTNTGMYAIFKHLLPHASGNGIKWYSVWKEFYKKCAAVPDDGSRALHNVMRQNVRPYVTRSGDVIFGPIVGPVDDQMYQQMTECVKDFLPLEIWQTLAHPILAITTLFYLAYSFRLFDLHLAKASLRDCTTLEIDQSSLPEFERHQVIHQLRPSVIENGVVKVPLSKALLNALRTVGVLSDDNITLWMDAELRDEGATFMEGRWNCKWEIRKGQEKFGVDDFFERVRSGTLHVSKKKLREVTERVKANNSSPVELLRYHVMERLHYRSGSSIIEKLFQEEDVPLPERLTTALREYQITAYRWGINNLMNGFGIILADEMGLGKTLQAIAIMTYLIQQGHAKRIMVLCPAILVENWLREFGKHGDLDLSGAVTVLSYEMFGSRYESLHLDTYDMLVMDEAHRIKNPNTHMWKLIKKCPMKLKMCITGTPVENSPLDLWALFDIIVPGYLGNRPTFSKMFLDDADLLRKMAAPFMLRRLKSECAVDIPPKLESVKRFPLSPEQRRAYRACLSSGMNELKSGASRFKLATALKMVCNDVIYPTGAATSKWTFVRDLVASLGPTEKAVIFTQYIQTGNLLSEGLGAAPFLHGSMPSHQRQKMIDDFQHPSGPQLLIVSVRSGGSGLTLTQANHIILFDLWWNPAVIDQAIDRAHRIGQTRTVKVFTLLTTGTIEERIHDMINTKRDMSKQIMKSTEVWLSKMSEDEIIRMFALVDDPPATAPALLSSS